MTIVTDIPSTDPRLMMRRAPMSASQKMAVAVTFILSALDGFDVLAITLAAPDLSTEWGLHHGGLGAIFAAGLIGMAVGAIMIAPAADTFGRRALILFCLGMMALGMLAGALSPGMNAMIFSRAITGLGIGAMLSLINPLATEFSNEKRRDMAISLMAIGYPVGGVLGSAAASFILTYLDWRSIFYAGAILSLAAIPMVLKWLPEPLSFLIEKPRPNSLARVNILLNRFGLPAVETLPQPAKSGARYPVSALFTKDHISVTLRVTLMNILFVVPVYYVLTWLPQLVADLGFSGAQAAEISLASNIAGIFGGIAFGWLAGAFGLKRVGFPVFVLFALMCTAFSLAPADMALLLGMAILLGLFLFSGMCAIHAAVSRSFPDHMRASGAGIALGLGRAASAISPLIVGSLFVSGAGRGVVSGGMTAMALVAALLLLTLGGLGKYGTGSTTTARS